MAKLLSIVSISLLFSVSLFIYYQFQKHVPENYVDEIFHVPQTQRYCKFDFQYWDDKITTLPGLYVFAAFLSVLTKAVIPIDIDFCTTASLRFINVLLIIPGFIVIYKCLCLLRPFTNDITSSNNKNQDIQVKKRTYAIYTVALLLHPIYFFFHQLYYTDVFSTLSILLVYYLSLKNKYTLSSIVGFYSVFIRQTNIIWIFFIALISIEDLMKKKLYKKDSVPESALYNSFYLGVSDFIKFTLSNIPLIVTKLYGYIFVGLSFIAFLYINKGIVVGDKSNHESSFHFTQLLYFSLYCFIFNAPSTLLSIYSPFNYVKDQLNNLKNRPLKTIVIYSVLSLFLYKMIDLFTYTHIFILSDNRHYSFYIWNKILLKYPWSRFALIPVYIYCISMVWNTLKAAKRSFLWCIFFISSVSIVLLPSPLFECRYFIIPFFIYQLNSARPNIKNATNQTPTSSIILDIIYLSLINFITIYVFIKYPFIYPDQTIGRKFW